MSTPAVNPWTPEKVEQLGKLHHDGLSASRIAQRLGGVTRNAVIGKLNRLGLKMTPTARAATHRLSNVPQMVAAKKRAQKPAKAPRPAKLSIAGNGVVFEQAPPAPPPKLQAIEVVEGPGLATPLTIGRHACRWPIGDPLLPDFTYCGRSCDGAYCHEHSQVAYRPARTSEAALERSCRRFA